MNNAILQFLVENPGFDITISYNPGARAFDVSMRRGDAVVRNRIAEIEIAFSRLDLLAERLRHMRDKFRETFPTVQA
jgi:hypothetical protein